MPSTLLYHLYPLSTATARLAATSLPTTLLSTTENRRDDDDYLKRSKSAKAIEELRVFETQSSNTKKTDVRRREQRLPGHEAPGEETRKREKTHKKDAKRQVVNASV